MNIDSKAMSIRNKIRDATIIRDVRSPDKTFRGLFLDGNFFLYKLVYKGEICIQSNDRSMMEAGEDGLFLVYFHQYEHGTTPPLFVTIVEQR